jgi:hypothetical protein
VRRGLVGACRYVLVAAAMRTTALLAGVLGATAAAAIAAGVAARRVAGRAAGHASRAAGVAARLALVAAGSTAVTAAMTVALAAAAVAAARVAATHVAAAGVTAAHIAAAYVATAGIAAGRHATGHHAAAGDGHLASHAAGHHAAALVRHTLGNHDRVALRHLRRHAAIAAHLAGDLLGHHAANRDLRRAGHTLTAAYHARAGHLDHHLVGAPDADRLHRRAAAAGIARVAAFVLVVHPRQQALPAGNLLALPAAHIHALARHGGDALARPHLFHDGTGLDTGRRHAHGATDCLNRGDHAIDGADTGAGLRHADGAVGGEGLRHALRAVDRLHGGEVFGNPLDAIVCCSSGGDGGQGLGSGRRLGAGGNRRRGQEDIR